MGEHREMGWVTKNYYAKIVFNKITFSVPFLVLFTSRPEFMGTSVQDPDSGVLFVRVYTTSSE